MTLTQDRSRHRIGEAVDINSSTATEDIVVAGFTKGLIIHVEPSGDAQVDVSFMKSNSFNTTVTKRTQSENGNLSSTGGGDIYVRIEKIASPFVRLEIIDNSGAQNDTDYNILVE